MDSYNTWSEKEMHDKVVHECTYRYYTTDVEKTLNRSWKGIYIEWWLHNIGYWFTLPFIKNKEIEALNLRFKHVDLEEHK
jgi:hypothetical protein